MRPLAAVEQFFERLFERPSARLFHAPLQPIQVQRRLERAMDAGRVDSSDRAYVPNRYTVTLHPADAEAFDGIHATVEDELGEALHARARARGYRLIARPTVRLRVSGTVARGDIEVDAEALDRRHLKRLGGHGDRSRAAPSTGGFAPPPRVATGPGMHIAPVVPASIATVGAVATGPTANLPSGNGATTATPRLSFAPVGALPSEDRAMPLRPGSRRVPAPTPPTGAYVRISPTGPSSGSAASPAAVSVRPIATVEVRTSGRMVATRRFDGATLRVGRARDNELVLADERVSRHHGQLTARRGVLVYADLDSTNGSFVNGTRVHEIVLGSGDVVRLGNSTLTIHSQS